MSQFGVIISFITILGAYIAYDNIGEKQLLVYFFLLLLSFIIVPALIRTWSKRLFVAGYSFVYGLFAFIEFVHSDLFNSNITTSTISIFLETNSDEVSEFLNSYIKFHHSIIGFAIICSIILGILFTSKNKRASAGCRKKELIRKSLTIATIVLLIACVLTLKRQFLPFQIFQAFTFYKNQKTLVDSVQVGSNGLFKDTFHNSDQEKETYVVIIGESTTRDHMSIYDYYRKTNPLLEKRKKQLMVFKDVISPHTHTITSLGKVLTLGNYDAPQKKYNSTIVQLFNSVDFDTYWISNQRPMGIYETSTSIVSRQSDTSIFTDVAEGSLDEKVLDPLKDVLEDGGDKKFIVIHLMGTHLAYKKRYPKEFEVFSMNPKTTFKHNDAFRIINEYDNAVLYNDFIVNEIIAAVEEQQSKSFVIYLSDHGEDVYQTMDLNGHLEENGSKPMYDIPFFLWRSEEYLLDNKGFVFDVNRPYSSEDFIHTLAQLAGINFKGYENEKSLVSPKFEVKKRIILNDKTYEETFNTME